jgi:hypothetical protein
MRQRKNCSEQTIFYLTIVIKEMNLEVDEEKKKEIASVITSPDSPVGIDAKKTHIIIINKLVEIEKRLEELEKLH